MQLQFDTERAHSKEEQGFQNSFGIALEENTVVVDKLLEISFQRTIRVPDNDQTSNLPPGLGQMKLTNVNQVASKLPDTMASKGGLLVSMYGKCPSQSFFVHVVII